MNAFFRFLLGNTAAESDKPVANAFFSPEEKLTFDETVSQMSRGYENTQRVIQFMDTKAGAIVALSLAIYAFVGKVAAWAFEKTDATVLKAFPCLLMCVLIFLGLAVMVCGFVSLIYAFKTVRPNPLPDWQAFSTLFPAHDKNYEGKAREKLKPMVMGATCGFVVDEYQNQLVAIGQIVHRKINWLRISIDWLRWQGLASVLLICVIAGMAFSGHLVKSEPPAAIKKTEPSTVTLPISLVF